MQDKHKVSPAYDLDSVDWPNANWRFWPASAWFADSATFKSPVNQIAAWKRQRNLVLAACLGEAGVGGFGGALW